jgi:hypothetical protein
MPETSIASDLRRLQAAQRRAQRDLDRAVRAYNRRVRREAVEFDRRARTSA